MRAALEALASRHDFRLEVVDVDGDDALEARYGMLVPLLADEHDREICHYHLDMAALSGFFPYPLGESVLDKSADLL
jgi:hypothetical protein